MGITEVASNLFMLLLTASTFTVSLYFYRKTKLSILHPLLVSVLIIVLVLKSSATSYEAYAKGNRIVDFLLGPAVVALGYGLYEQWTYIRSSWLSVLTAILVGSIVGVASVAGIALIMKPEYKLVMTLFPKSVTSPIAIEITKGLGGIPSLSAVIVIAVGIFGGIVGPFILNAVGIKSKIAKGLALGASSHGVGTARAIELGAVEGAVSGLAIGLMGLATAIVAPLVKWLLF